MATRDSVRDKAAEELLVLRCQLRDERAFAQLFTRYHDSLLYYLRRLTGEADASEDLLQNVWLQVYRKVSTLKNPGAFRTWLFRIAHNQAVQRFRKLAPEVLLEETGFDPGSQADPDEFGADDAARINSALARLSAPHREVLSLRFLEEMSYEEIATVTGCSLGTIRSRIHYAKRALKQALERLDHAIEERVRS